MGWDERKIPNLWGRVAIVTGANSGIGFEAAQALSARGAHVILACRDRTRGREALARLLQLQPAASVRLALVDLSNASSIRIFARWFLAEYEELDLLINNAGVMTPSYTRTSEGHELQFATNHLGHFLLTACLWPALSAAASARVVTVSSRMHVFARMQFDDLDHHTHHDQDAAYGQSKLANLLFTAELARRTYAAGSSVQAIAVHPGSSTTNLDAQSSSFEKFRLLNQSARSGAMPTASLQAQGTG